MASNTKVTHVSGAEAERRAKQSAQSEQAKDAQPVSSVTADQDLFDAATEAGYTPEQIAEAEREIAAVNLDEMVTHTIQVAISERVTETYTGVDGQPATRNKNVVRLVDLIADMDAETQLQFLSIVENRPDTKDKRIMSEFLAKQVLLMWQLTEPDMTLERLLRGLSMERIKKLADAFFK